MPNASYQRPLALAGLNRDGADPPPVRRPSTAVTPIALLSSRAASLDVAGRVRSALDSERAALDGFSNVIQRGVTRAVSEDFPHPS
jgi:hypothetical protein